MRTDKKNFVKQLTKIERRQARIRRIRHKSGSLYKRENVPSDPAGHYHIGRSQNQFEHIGTFLRSFKGDPAIKVS